MEQRQEKITEELYVIHKDQQRLPNTRSRKKHPQKNMQKTKSAVQSKKKKVAEVREQKVATPLTTELQNQKDPYGGAD